MTSSTDYLGNNISQERLEEIYAEKFYDYLDSPQFHDQFLRPLGELINGIELPVLDIGCGEGWLADHIKPEIGYIGVEGSETALARASLRHSRRIFYKSRVEQVRAYGSVGTLVLGGILSNIVRRDKHLEFIRHYRDLNPSLKYLLVYDLQRLDTTHLAAEFPVLSSFLGDAKVSGLMEVKRKRKVSLFRLT